MVVADNASQDYSAASQEQIGCGLLFREADDRMMPNLGQKHYKH